MTQAEAVIGYCKTYGSITSYDAFLDCGIIRLPVVIDSIKKMGLPVTKHNETVINRRTGKKTHITRYYIGEASS